jgi:hypothetical protein
MMYASTKVCLSNQATFRLGGSINKQHNIMSTIPSTFEQVNITSGGMLEFWLMILLLEHKPVTIFE